MKKYFICADIHSFYDEWMDALLAKGFEKENKNHMVIVCGDLLDRGSQSYECVKFITELLDEDRAICIMGNHEILFQQIARTKQFYITDIKNGTVKTYEKFYEHISSKQVTDEEMIAAVYNHPLIQQYLQSLRWYYETEKYIFVHSWIPDEENWRKGSWANAVWVNPFDEWKAGKIVEGKTIFCGHWHTFEANSVYHNSGCKSLDDALMSMSVKELTDYGKYAREGNKNYIKIINKYMDFSPFRDEGIWALDAATAYSRQVNIVTRTNGMKHV